MNELTITISSAFVHQEICKTGFWLILSHKWVILNYKSYFSKPEPNAQVRSYDQKKVGA